MAELYEDWLISKMTRAEHNELSDEEKQERKRLKKKFEAVKYKTKNNERSRRHYENNKDVYLQRSKKIYNTPEGRKSNKISSWVNDLGLQESREDLDRIYELYLHQELCNACDRVLTRDGNRCNTYASMDHDHDTHRFRHIICHDCNSNDKWKQYFC
tara:strand:- start:38 stop:508 length:471 start_codon:yes stop_codon:yes gene_type:complete